MEGVGVTIVSSNASAARKTGGEREDSIDDDVHCTMDDSFDRMQSDDGSKPNRFLLPFPLVRYREFGRTQSVPSSHMMKLRSLLRSGVQLNARSASLRL